LATTLLQTEKTGYHVLGAIVQFGFQQDQFAEWVPIDLILVKPSLYPPYFIVWIHLWGVVITSHPSISLPRYMQDATERGQNGYDICYDLITEGVEGGRFLWGRVKVDGVYRNTWRIKNEIGWQQGDEVFAVATNNIQTETDEWGSRMSRYAFVGGQKMHFSPEIDALLYEDEESPQEEDQESTEER
jgi:hypothetical protein